VAHAVMPIAIAVILELLPINHLDTFPRFIISGLVGLTIGMIIFFILRKYQP
jgi:putative flippase GtrA